MKYIPYILFTVSLCLISSCGFETNDNTHSATTNQYTQLSLRTDYKTYKMKDYGDYYAFFEKTTGDFYFCFECNSNLLLDEIIFDGIITYSHEGYIRVQDKQGNFDIVFYAPHPNRIIDESSFDSSTVKHLMNYVGRSSNVVDDFFDDPTFSWVPDNPEDLKPSCECVDITSSPCGDNGHGDGVDGCDVGGEGSTGCGVTSGATGFGTGATNGCNISCDSGYYACCNY